jgi:hypothetical protein
MILKPRLMWINGPIGPVILYIVQYINAHVCFLAKSRSVAVDLQINSGQENVANIGKLTQNGNGKYKILLER